MGVQGLWTLITPVARPIKLETMGGKKLAIDSSIWLYQFQNALRDREGRGLTNAHILGFLRRISKLLYYGIKPVFVFDGEAPLLKKQTIRERKKRKQGGQENLAKTAEKLLAAQLRQAAVVQAQRRVAHKETGDEITSTTVYFDDNLSRDFAEKNQKGKRPTSPTSSTLKESPKKPKYVPKDQYQLPPLTARTPPKEGDHRLATEEELNQFINQLKPEDLDINSPHFQSLSTEMKYEIIGDLRVKSRQQNHARVEAMKRKNDQDFSQIQIMHLKQRNELTQKLLTVTDMVAKANLTIPVKIAAQRNKEYVLVKAQEGWVLGMSNQEGGSKKSPVKIDIDSENDEDFGGAADHLEPKIHRRTTTVPPAEDSDGAEFEEVAIPSTTLTETSETINPRDHMSDAIRYHYGSQNEPRVMSPMMERSGHTAAELFNPDEDEDENDQIMMEIAMFESQSTSRTGRIPATGSNVIRRVGHEARLDLEEGPSNSCAINLLDSRERRRQVDQAIPNSMDVDLELDDDFAMFAPPDSAPCEKVHQPAPSKNHDETAEPDDHQVFPSLEQNTQMQTDMELKLNYSTYMKHSPSKHGATQSTATQGLHTANDLEPDVDFPMFQTRSPLPLELVVEESHEPLKSMTSEECEMGCRVERERPDEVLSQMHSGVLTGAAAPLRPSLAADLEIYDKSLERSKQLSAVDLAGKEDHSRLNLASGPPSFEGIIGEIRSLPTSRFSSECAGAGENPSQNVTPSSLSALTPTNPPQPDQSESVPRVAPSTSKVTVGPSVASAIELNHCRKSVSVNDESMFPTKPAALSATRSPCQNSREAGAHGSDASTRPGSFNQLSKPIDGSLGTKQVDDDSLADEEAIPWSRSPTPVARRTPGLKQSEAMLSYVASEPEDDESDVAPEAEERQLAHDLEYESTEWSNFLSGLQNAEKLDELRHQADLEVNQLKEKRVKDRRDADDVNVQMSKDVQSMLRFFGIPYVVSPMEAEAQCAELLRLGLVDGIITDDSDVFLFGGTRVYKNMFNQNKFVECYLMNDLEKELGLGRDKLIQLAYLLGSDYTEGLLGVGPVTAMEILSEFDEGDELSSGLNGLLKFKQWWKRVQLGKDTEKESGTTFRRKFRKKKDKIWLDDHWPDPAVAEAYHKPTVDTSGQAFTWGLPDLDGIRQFLSDHLNWPPNKTDDVVLPLIKRQTQRINGVAHTQGVLDSFFDYSHTDSNAARAPPPRVASGFQSQKLHNIVHEWRQKQKERQGQNQDISIASEPTTSSVDAGLSRTKKAKTKKITQPKQTSKMKAKSPPPKNASGSNVSKPKRVARAKKSLATRHESNQAQSTKDSEDCQVNSPEERLVMSRPTRAKLTRRIESSDNDYNINSSSEDY